MQELYFAYGSNMSSRRLRERLPSARSLGQASLADHRLATNKPGRDGSGKANLVATDGQRAWGVLYAVTVSDWRVLDRFELDYLRVHCEVVDHQHQRRIAHFYVWNRLGPELAPFDWYLAHLVEGAREHGLPRHYIAQLEAWPRRLSRAE